MKMRNAMKKGFSALLALNMVLSSVPLSAFAADGNTLCEHHPEHTAECGYVAFTTGAPCNHTHEESCGYVEAVAGTPCACEPGEDGTLTHGEDCGYVEGTAGSPCTHVHDDSCGYAEAQAGSECTYECAQCVAALTDDETTEPSTEATTEATEPSTEATEPSTVATEPSAEEALCDCGTDDPAWHATSCPAYAAPEDPQCYCVEKCTEPNEWCDICGFDYTACAGEDGAAVYEETECTHSFDSYGKCTVCGASAAAKIRTTYFATLPEALASSDGEYNVVALADYAEDFTVPYGVHLYGGEYTFSGTVTNEGSMEVGIYSGTVINNGSIFRGTYDGAVTNNYMIYDGTFNRTVTNNGSIQRGNFNDTLINESQGTIENKDWEQAYSFGENFVFISNGGTVTCEYHYEKTPATCTRLAVCQFGCVYGELAHLYINGFCCDCGIEESATLAGGVYKISNAGQLFWFAEHVNAGNGSASAVLTADIDLENRAWTPIGRHSDTEPDSANNLHYTGTFDGKGHIIRNLNVVVTDTWEAGLFSRVDQGTLANFGIINATVESTQGIRCGVIAGEIQNAAVNNVFSAGTITITTANADGQAGGIAGECAGTTLTNCYTTYGMLTTNNSTTANNCYYLAAAANTNSVGTNMAAEAFTSGETAYLLGEGWGQTIGTDNYPILGGEKVYEVQNCGSVGYANTYYGTGHSFDNGFCSICGGYEPAVLDNGVYKIYNAGQLYWFAAMVNGTNDYMEQNTSADAELHRTIVVNKNVLNDDGTLNGTPSRSWTPIGSRTVKYNGNFDGRGLSISGLYFNDSTTGYVGLFGNLAYASVQNVGIRDSYFYGKNDVGGIAGRSNHSSVNNCYNTGTVSTKYEDGNIINSNVGGIVGYNTSDITNCYNTGAVTSFRYPGGIAGYNTGDVTNCYNTGTVTRKRGGGGIIGSIGGTVTNCYYLDTSYSYGSDTGEEGAYEPKTAEQFASGEVAYLLNGDQSTIAFKQYIGSSATPAFTGGTVYYGYLSCGDAEKIYTNDSSASAERSGHTPDADGYTDIGNGTHSLTCTVCGTVTEAHASDENSVFTDNGDGTHNFTCACGATDSEEHTAVDGPCPCGACDHTGGTVEYTLTADGSQHVATWSCCNAEVTENHTFDPTDGKCQFCEIDMAQAKVTIESVDTYYETLTAALADTESKDATVTLCKSVDIGNTNPLIGKDVTFIGGEYTVSSGLITNMGTIVSGTFTATVNNDGCIQGGSFTHIQIPTGPASITGPVSFEGLGIDCGLSDLEFDLSNADIDGASIFSYSEALPVDLLNLPAGYTVQVNGEAVDVLPSGTSGTIVSHTHIYGAPSYSWTDDPTKLTVSVACTACGDTLTDSTTDMTVTTSADGFTTIYTAAVTLDGETYTDSYEVTNQVTRVNITWGTMDFTYTDESGWNNPESAWVQVENIGNTAVTVTYTYSTERTDIKGSFYDGTATLTAPVTIDTVDNKKKVWLRLDGQPSEALSNTTIGSVKLTIE